MMQWTLVVAGKTTLTELSTVATLDDMLMMYDLYMYTVDVERGRAKDMEEKQKADRAAHAHSPSHGRH